MTGIQYRKGHIFSMIVDHAKDAEWKLQESYYKAQGCEVVMTSEVKFWAYVTQFLTLINKITSFNILMVNLNVIVLFFICLGWIP
jgi:hypothetical protein